MELIQTEKSMSLVSLINNQIIIAVVLIIFKIFRIVKKRVSIIHNYTQLYRTVF